MDTNDYKLGCHRKTSGHHHEIIFIRPVSSAELERFHTALNDLGNYSNYCGLYEICDKNYSSIISYLLSLKDSFPQNRNRLNEYVEESLQETNRLFLNYLSSSRTFLDHLKTRYTRLQNQGYSALNSYKVVLMGYSYFDDYQRMTTACYDSNFAYRFFYKLRNYVQHCGLPLGSMHIDESPGPNGSAITAISIRFNRDGLIHDYDGWGKVKPDLMKQPEIMEFPPYLKEFRSQIKLIHWALSGIEVSSDEQSWQYLYDMVREVQDKYGNVMPFIGRKSMDTGTQSQLKKSDFPLHTMAKFQADHKKIYDFQERLRIKKQSTE